MSALAQAGSVKTAARATNDQGERAKRGGASTVRIDEAYRETPDTLQFCEGACANCRPPRLVSSYDVGARMTPWPYAVLAAAVLFCLVLVLRTLPAGAGRCSVGRVRVRRDGASSPESLPAAVAACLRAMRANPHETAPITELATLLARRPRRLERLLLRRLARGPWQGEAAPAAAKVAALLGDIYARNPARRPLAELLRRVARETASSPPEVP